mgnify:FL=1
MDLTDIFKQVRQASVALSLIDDDKINKVLLALADETEAQTDYILAENAKDLAKMDEANPIYDRLKLTADRIKGIAGDMRNVTKLPSPLGRIFADKVLPNGLKVKKISVPFGVIGIIYEARPNVSFDVFSLCFKSGNACVLKGGTDAHCSNSAIVKLIHSVLDRFGINQNIVALLPAGREATGEMLNAVDYIDLIIPRGSSNLINFVRQNAKVPVIETGAGICHTYFDETGEKEKGADIIFNGKTRRVSVCNALDCVIINEKRLSDLPFLCERLATKNVIIYADLKAYTFLDGHYPVELLKKATDDSFGTEFLDYKLSIKTVANIDEALAHIAKYS